jgi:hypothetical protein
MTQTLDARMNKRKKKRICLLVKEEERIYKTNRKQLTKGRNRVLPVNNYLEWKCIEFAN